MDVHDELIKIEIQIQIKVNQGNFQNIWNFDGIQLF